MRLAYNTLDFWISYYLADYVSLNSSQERDFEVDLDNALLIHRDRDLPKLHRLISELQSDLKKPLTFSQTRGYHFKLTKVGQDSIGLLAIPLASMIRDLNEDQIAELNRNIEKSIEDVIAERAILPTKQKMAKRTRQLQEISLDWIGTLTYKQKQLLHELAEYQVEMEPIFFSFYRSFLQNWRGLMEKRFEPDFDEKLSQMLQKFVALENEQLQIDINVYLNRRFDVMRRLNNSLNDKQRRYLDRKLSGIRIDLAILIHQ
ncbi:hypothetical protein C9I89_00810 [Photobacterium lipolyticum]|uniref:Uncharacterized protein n=2 Tax=Photobacterium lipolyticum TaxID=266810 RepID=A0A2T3N5I3_9GAMM|nr:hypothetical protein C9I89_00810 [Photobacterium lipolyticum]